MDSDIKELSLIAAISRDITQRLHSKIHDASPLAESTSHTMSDSEKTPDRDTTGEAVKKQGWAAYFVLKQRPLCLGCFNCDFADASCQLE
jgi:hypothetical protein